MTLESLKSSIDVGLWVSTLATFIKGPGELPIRGAWNFIDGRVGDDRSKVDIASRELLKRLVSSNDFR